MATTIYLVREDTGSREDFWPLDPAHLTKEGANAHIRRIALEAGWDVIEDAEEGLLKADDGFVGEMFIQRMELEN